MDRASSLGGVLTFCLSRLFFARICPSSTDRLWYSFRCSGVIMISSVCDIFTNVSSPSMPPSSSSSSSSSKAASSSSSSVSSVSSSFGEDPEWGSATARVTVRFRPRFQRVVHATTRSRRCVEWTDGVARTAACAKFRGRAAAAGCRAADNNRRVATLVPIASPCRCAMTGGSLFRAAAAATAEVSARSERLDDVFGRVRRPRQAPSTCARCLPEIRVCSSRGSLALRAASYSWVNQSFEQQLCSCLASPAYLAARGVSRT